MTALVTTIIPTFQRPKLLKRAIASVLNQTYPHFQILVCDNASQDETEALVQELAKKDSRIQYLRHPKNIGAWPNFQYGLDCVKTEFFSFLSDDDVLFPWFYQTVLPGFKSFPQAALSAGSTIIMKNDGKILDVSLRSWPKEGCYSPPQSMLQMIGGKHPVWPSVIFRKEAADRIGGLDVQVGPPLDVDFELRMASRFPIVISKKPCGIFCIYDTSCSGSVNVNYFWPGWDKLVHNALENKDFSPKLKKKTKQLLINDFYRYILDIMHQALFKKKFSEVHACAVVLKGSYGLPFKGAIMSMTAKACERSDLIFNIIHTMQKIKHSLKIRLKQILKSNAMEAKFGHYKKWLET